MVDWLAALANAPAITSVNGLSPLVIGLLLASAFAQLCELCPSIGKRGPSLDQIRAWTSAQMDLTAAEMDARGGLLPLALLCRPFPGLQSFVPLVDGPLSSPYMMSSALPSRLNDRIAPRSPDQYASLRCKPEQGSITAIVILKTGPEIW